MGTLESKEIERFVAVGSDGKQYIISGWIRVLRSTKYRSTQIDKKYFTGSGQSLIKLSDDEFKIESSGIILKRKSHL